jgi:hypothetical protein
MADFLQFDGELRPPGMTRAGFFMFTAQSNSQSATLFDLVWPCPINFATSVVSTFWTTQYHAAFD